MWNSQRQDGTMKCVNVCVDDDSLRGDAVESEA